MQHRYQFTTCSCTFCGFYTCISTIWRDAFMPTFKYLKFSYVRTAFFTKCVMALLSRGEENDSRHVFLSGTKHFKSLNIHCNTLKGNMNSSVMSQFKNLSTDVQLTAQMQKFGKNPLFWIAWQPRIVLIQEFYSKLGSRITDSKIIFYLWKCKTPFRSA